MKKFDIRTADMDQLEQRLAEIKEESDAEDADIQALTDETDALLERRKVLIQEAEQRKALAAKVGAGAVGRTVRSFAGSQPPSYGPESPEYRRAFLKDLLGQELTREERAAFVHTTANTGAVVPTTMLTNIWDLVSEQHSIMGDITIYRTGTVIEVIKHTEIVQGKAKIVAENAANDDEKNTFVKVTLSGKDFSKHVDISYALQAMSVDTLEAYLVAEIGRGLGDAMAADVITQIGNDMTAGNKVTSAGVKTLTYKETAEAFAKIKRANTLTVYGTRHTIYTYLAGMVDTQGRPIFQPNAQAGVAGVLLGAEIKVEDAVADNVLLIGDPKRFTYNMVKDIMVESDRDIKKHVTTYSGYARGEGVLVDPDSFVQLTVKQA